MLGILLAGPTIMTWGTAEQKERHLAPILTAEEIWCQGFSEPDAGSDLASLKTRAVEDGDAWVVSGQKVWTSGAQYSKWCMLVARTDPDAPKHKGLTYFMLDMEQPGVTVVPLRQMTGAPEFNELFIDGARISGEQVLGGVGNGWKVALTTLMNERAGLAFFAQVRLRRQLDRLVAQAAARGLLDDPVVADRLGDLHLRTEVLRLTAYRGLTAIEKYGQPGPEGSLTKLMWSDTNQQLTQLAADLLGPDALRAGDPWAYELMRARGQLDRGGHDRGAQEHRRRAGARPAEGEGSGHGLRPHERAEGDQGGGARAAGGALAVPEGARSRRGRRLRRAAVARARRARLAGHRGGRVRRRPGPRRGRARGAAGGARLRVRGDAVPRRRRPSRPLIGATGSDAQRARWLPGLCSGEITAGLGTRELAADASEAAVIVLLDGAEAVLVDGAHATATPVTMIDGTRRFATVAGDGEPLGAGAAERVAAAVAAELVGVCQRALEMTVAYVKDRKQFGVPVGSFQAVSHRCADMLLQTESARSTALYAAWAADAAPDRLAEAAALAAAAAADGACAVTGSAIQAHGGIGFTWEADVHWLYKRAQLDAALLGGARRHRAALARIAAGRLAAAA